MIAGAAETCDPQVLVKKKSQQRVKLLLHSLSRSVKNVKSVKHWLRIVTAT